MSRELTPAVERIARACGFTVAQLEAEMAKDSAQAALAASLPQPTAEEIFANCGLSQEQVGIGSHAVALAVLSAQTDGLVLIQATPEGDFTPSDGRAMDVPAWRMTKDIAQRLIATFNHQQPPVIDYEHQTLQNSKNGQPAPAAGWFRGLKWIDGKGLYVVAELTKRARQMVDNGEYRFFSPVLQYSRQTGEVLNILMGALTNNPAIHGMDGVKAA